MNSNQKNVSLTCVLCGATSDIGFEILKGVLAKGYNVLATYRSEKNLSHISSKMRIHERVSFIKLDVEDEKSIEQFAHHCAQLDNISLFINMIGIVGYKPFLDYTSLEISRLLWINLQSAIQLIQIIIPLMLQSPASCKLIIQFGSMAGMKRGHKYFSVYSAAKEGLVGFFRSISSEFDDQNLHFILVRPAGVRTKIVEEAIGGTQLRPEFARFELDSPVDVAKGLLDHIEKDTDDYEIELFPTELSKKMTS